MAHNRNWRCGDVEKRNVSVTKNLFTRKCRVVDLDYRADGRRRNSKYRDHHIPPGFHGRQEIHRWRSSNIRDSST